LNSFGVFYRLRGTLPFSEEKPTFTVVLPSFACGVYFRDGIINYRAPQRSGAGGA
jgi:hypothetical protein